MSTVTPEDVTALTKPTEGNVNIKTALCPLNLRFNLHQRPFWYSENISPGFLCALSSNNFGIEFLQFTISDYQTKKTIFEVGKDNPTPQDISVDFSSLGEDMYRKIKYTFSEDVLRLPLIQTS